MTDITQIIPAPGWYVVYEDEDGRRRRTPLIGWGIRDGQVIPLAACQDGDVHDAATSTNFIEINHPDHWQEA